MIGYVAKDKDEHVYLYTEKPTYSDTFEIWYNAEMMDITGQFSEFNDISYTDEPIKVEIKLERV